MSLLDLKTNLKSLKYGQDQPGGGNSGLPYIKTDIDILDNSNRTQVGRLINELRLTKFDDGLVRGGIIGAANASIVDTLRIGKFFLDAPQGPLFIVKQVGLQLANPRLETKQLPTNNPTTSDPTSTQGFLNNVSNIIINVANRINNAVGPTRIYNLGINTLAQIPLNAFGGHIVRHGILPIIPEDQKYFSVVNNNNENGTNRLLRLSTKFELGDKKLNSTIDDKTIQSKIQKAAKQFNINLQQPSFGNPAPGTRSLTFPNGRISSIIPNISKTVNIIPRLGINKSDVTIDDYIGGPSSVYGIGRTLIKRYDNTEDAFKIDPAITYSNIFAGMTRNDKGDPEEVKIKDTRDFVLSYYVKSDLSSKGWVYNDEDKLNNSFLYYTALNNTSDSLEKSKMFAGESRNDKGEPTHINWFNTLGVSKQYSDGNEEEIKSLTKINSKSKSVGPDNAFQSAYDALVRSDPTINLQPDPVSGSVSGSTASSYLKNVGIKGLNLKNNLSYKTYRNIIESKQLNTNGNNNNIGIYENPGIGDKVLSFETYDSNIPGLSSGILPKSDKQIIYKNGYGDTVTISDKIPWNKATRELRVGSGRRDEINLTPIFTGNAHFSGDGTDDKYRDLIKFRIQAVNTDNPNSGQWMVFRAYLTDLADDVSADWQDIKYAGRGDKFYIYNGFARKMNISFKVAALSADEMQFIYQKLNFLMSNAMPDYSDNLMRGPLVRMTVGNWIDCQLGILNSVNFKIPQDSPWEIALDEPEGGKKQLILPHVVEVTLGFTPIGSETRGTNLISEKSEFKSHIAQNNTGDIKNLQYIGINSSIINNPPTLTQNPNNSPVTKIAAPPTPNIRASTPQAPQQSQTSLITPQVQSLDNGVSQNIFNSLVRPSGNTSLQPQVPFNPTNDPQNEYINSEGTLGINYF